MWSSAVYSCQPHGVAGMYTEQNVLTCAPELISHSVPLAALKEAATLYRRQKQDTVSSAHSFCIFAKYAQLPFACLVCAQGSEMEQG